MTQTLINEPLSRLGNWLGGIAERSTRGRAIAKLNAMTDEELAAAGTTRMHEAQRALGMHNFL